MNDFHDDPDAALSKPARELLRSVAEFAERDVSRLSTAGCAEQAWAGDLIRQACRLGYAGIEIPASDQGLGLPYSMRARVAEVLARTDFAFAFAFINQHNVALRIAEHGSAAARARYLPGLLAGELIGGTAMSEPRAGSDFAAIATTARRLDAGWILDGEKAWVANAVGGELALVFAQTDAARGPAGIACFIVDLRSPQCERVTSAPLEGLGAAGIGGIRLTGYQAEESDVLYAPGKGFSMALAGVNKARTHIAAMAAGLLDSALRQAVRHASTRQAFGRPIIEQQGIRWSLAEVSTRLQIMQMLTQRAAALIDAGDDEAVTAAAMAKKYAGEQCLDAVADCVQVLGASGLLRSQGMARRLLAAKALCFADGTTEMMNERVAAGLAPRFAAVRAVAQTGGAATQEIGGMSFQALKLSRAADGATQAELADVSEDELPVGDVLVQIAYSSLNYKDALAITGKSPVVRSFPMVPGIDFAGTVRSSADPRFKPGDAVLLNGWGLGETRWGGLSQLARVPADWLLPMPDGMGARQAMAIGTAGYTAMLCVMALERHNMQPDGGPVLVTGANGGVGTVAIALLAAQGYTVTASTGRPQEADYLRGLGASGILDRAALSSPGKPLQKEAWSAAVDCVGSHTLANVLAGMRYGAPVAACGLAQGMDLPATVAPFILRGVSLIGVDSVYAPMALRATAWARLATELPRAMLEANTRELGLSEVAAAAGPLLEGRIRGRIVVDVNR